MENVIVTEEADSVLRKENKLQAVWMRAALEVMRLYNLEQLSLAWAFNFRDCDIRNAFVEYILESHDRIILEFQRRYLTFGFEVRYTGSAIDKADLEKFKDALSNRYELDSLKVDLIISYMEIDEVLIIDFDPQANSSSAFMSYENYEKLLEDRKVISEIFTDIDRIIGPVSNKIPQLLTLSDLMVNVKQEPQGGKIDMVVSELELSKVLERSGGAAIEDRLSMMLEKKKNAYDYVLIELLIGIFVS